MANSEAVSDILRGTGGGGLDSIVGQKVTLVGFEADTGLYGPLVVLNIVDGEGTELSIKTSSGIVIEQVEKLQEVGAFPVDVVVTKGAGSRPGTSFYKLADVE